MNHVSVQPTLSVIVPMYNESESIRPFLERIIPILEGITPAWEIIAINDGSRDGSLSILQEAHAQDTRIKTIALARNFGKEAALTAGLHYATGAAVIPVDADLQDPPELIPQMVEEWQKGFKVVLATRRSRATDEFLKRFTAKLFYRLFSKVSRVKIPENTGDFRLMDAQVVEVLRLLPERTRFMKGLFAWVGFSTTQIFYDRPERSHGTTKFNIISLMRLAFDGIFSFTTLPLRIWIFLGLLISLLSLSYAIYLVLRTWLHGVQLPGYTSLMVGILFMGGIQLISLGVIGEYIGRIYRETKQRPLYVVEKTLGIDKGKYHG